MALTIKHTKVSTIPDGADASLIRPSDWNADHSFTGTMDISQGGTGQTTANDALNALLPSQSGQATKVLTTDGTNTTWAASGGGLTGTTQSATPFKTALGNGAGINATGIANTAIGYNALTAATSAANNVAIGYLALDSATSATGSVVIGSQAGTAVTNQTNNTFIGYQAGEVCTGASNVFVGSGAGDTATSVVAAVLVGMNSGAAMTSAAVGTVGVGFGVFNGLSSGANNTAVGSTAGYVISSGANNTLMGYQAGNSITTSSHNTCMGFTAGAGITTGAGNTFIGSIVGDAASTITNATAVGYGALSAIATSAATGTTAIGYNALNALTTGAGNTTLGSTTGALLTTGGGNTLIGNGAGSVLTTGSNNTIIGAYPATGAATLTGAVILSDGAGNARFYASSTGAVSFNGTNFGSDGQVLKSIGTAGAPTWSAVNQVKYRTVTATNAIIATDNVVFADATAGSMTLTLPSASLYGGLTLTVKRIDSVGANVLTIASAGGNIEGLPTQTMGPGIGVCYCSDGANWWELSNG